MKTSVIYTLLFLLISSTAFADVLIVDNKANRPTGSNIYSGIPAAITAAVAGDTILVTPSGATYGNITISKSLSIIGGGYNPTKDNPMFSYVGVVTISSGVSNVLISGMVVSSYINIGNTTGAVTDVIIEKNQINYINSNASTLSNILIRSNFINTTTNTYPISLAVTNQSNIIVQNNIISKPGAYYYAGLYVPSGGVTIDHNLFADNGGNQCAFYSLTNCLVSNNIFYGSSATPYTTSVINYQNNITYGATNNTLPTGAGYTASNNIVDTDPLLENFAIGFYNFTKSAVLSAISPAKSAGNDGSDLGIYGGLTPYKDSGVSLPVVKSIILPTAVVQGTNTNASIEVSGN